MNESEHIPVVSSYADEINRVLFDCLGRGGAFQYICGTTTHPNGESEKDIRWYGVGKTGRMPDADNICWGIHPAINRGGPRQRAHSDDIAAINCLDVGFDAKDFCGHCGESVTRVRDSDEGEDHRMCSGCKAKDPRPNNAAALAKVQALEPRPSVVIDSGEHYDCIWLLEEPLILEGEAERERACRVRGNWANCVGGDTRAKDLARTLPMPGTPSRNLEQNPDSSRVAYVWAETDRLYSLEYLERISQPAEEESSQTTYVETMLLREMAILAVTLSGFRDTQLALSSYALGQIVGAGHLTCSWVENLLLAMALRIGLPVEEAKQTIRKGLDAGERKPRQLPETDRPTADDRSVRDLEQAQS